MKTFPNYDEWRSAITGACGLILTADYCRERTGALNDASDKSTQAFTETYGKEYLAQVIAWFQQAESEATE